MYRVFSSLFEIMDNTFSDLLLGIFPMFLRSKRCKISNAACSAVPLESFFCMMNFFPLLHHHIRYGVALFEQRYCLLQKYIYPILKIWLQIKCFIVFIGIFFYFGKMLCPYLLPITTGTLASKHHFSIFYCSMW